MDKENKSLYEMLKEYSQSGYTPFHMPGHKRAEFDFLPNCDIDITEIDGFDNLHEANGILKDSMQFASEVFGTLYTRYLVGGSTCGILTGIRSLTKDGDCVLIARNCHKSVFNAVELLRLKAHYILPTCEKNFFASVTPNSIDEALCEYKDTKLVVITSPTYEGVLSDIEGIAKVCKKHGAKLFVDEAHGAHLGFGSFERSARHLGADLVVESVHKTLPSLTQTALLHVCSKDVDIHEIDRNLAIFESSSPSYLLMSAIDGCVRYMSTANALDEWERGIDYARQELKNLKHLKLFDCEDTKNCNVQSDANCRGDVEKNINTASKRCCEQCENYCQNVFGYDKSKFVILCDECNLNGVEIADVLRKKYKIEIEMASENYLIAMSGAGDNMMSFKRIINALKEIDKSVFKTASRSDEFGTVLPERVLYPYEIAQSNTEYVDIKDCDDVIVAENIWAYPPGCPIFVKGERIQKSDIEKLLVLKNIGVDISSEYGSFPNALRIVK